MFFVGVHHFYLSQEWLFTGFSGLNDHYGHPHKDAGGSYRPSTYDVVRFPLSLAESIIEKFIPDMPEKRNNKDTANKK